MNKFKINGDWGLGIGPIPNPQKILNLLDLIDIFKI
jgi:hypothetical protein